MRLAKTQDIRQYQLDSWYDLHRDPAVSGIHYKDRKKHMRRFLAEMRDHGFIDSEELESRLANQESSKTTLAYVPAVRAIFGRGIPVPVFITPAAYRHNNAAYLLHTIEHHEYQHARDLTHGITLSDGTVLDHATTSVRDGMLDFLFEVRASVNELVNRPQSALQDHIRIDIEQRLRHMERDARRIPAQSVSEFSVRQEILRSIYRALSEGGKPIPRVYKR